MFAILSSHKNILSKKLLNDLIRSKSFMQTLALSAGKVKNICESSKAAESPLKGKNVVYIGGYGGIGLAACREMANKGIKSLTIMGRHNYLNMLEELQSANRELTIHFVNLNRKNGNLAIEAALNLSLEYMGHIDVLINSSTITSEKKRTPILDSDLVLNYPKNISSLDEFKDNLHKLHVNIVETTHSAISFMSQENGGRGGIIVNISSVFGMEPTTYGLVYAAIKQDIIDSTRVFAQKFQQNITGVTHLGICPGEYITYVLGKSASGLLASGTATNNGSSKSRHSHCIKPIIEAIENARNGSVWISDYGKLSEIKLNLVDNLSTPSVNQLNSAMTKDKTLIDPNFYTFTGAKNLLPASTTHTTSARSFSVKDEDKNLLKNLSEYDSPYTECDTNTPLKKNPPSVWSYNNSDAVLSWDKITGMREKAKDVIHKKFFTDRITERPAIGHENPAIVGTYLGPVKEASKSLLPTTSVHASTKRNFSAKGKEDTCEFDSPYAECNTSSSLERKSSSDDDTTVRLSWDKIAAMRDKAKAAIYRKFFTQQKEIPVTPPYGSENPAIVISYNGPVPSMKASNKIIKNQSEIADNDNTTDDTVEIKKFISTRKHIPTKPFAMGFQYYANPDALRLKKMNDEKVAPTQLRIVKNLDVASRQLEISSPLNGKNVALFGGYFGVPLVTCKEMAKKGIKNLIILGGSLSTEQEIRSTNPNLKVDFIPLRRRRNNRAGIDEALSKTVERMGNIDVLVHGNKIKNCYCPKMAISNCMRCVIDTEFCAIPYMSREYGHKGGTIINLSSVVGLEPLAFPNVHKAIRRGIINFTRTFAHQNFNPGTGITHMAICPGENIMKSFGNYVNQANPEELFKDKHETANECAKVIVKAIEKAENGTVWIIDVDKEKKLKLRKIWDSKA